MSNELLAQFSNLSKEELEIELNDRQLKIAMMMQIDDLDKMLKEIEVLEYLYQNFDERE